MHKQLVLLLGMVLGGPLPTTAQTPAPQIAQAQDHTTPTMTTVRTAPEPSLEASFLPPENPGKRAARFSYLFAGVYERGEDPGSLKSLSPMREVRNLSLTQSSPPPLQFWGGRLRRDSTPPMQKILLGPLPAGGPQDFVPPRQAYLGWPFSVRVYGVSLSYHFGRNAHSGHATQIWRSLVRVVNATR
jgi:hypothetical protein